MSNTEFLKSHRNWNFCMPAYLITFKRLEAKQHDTCHNYKLTSGMYLFRFRSLYALCTGD